MRGDGVPPNLINYNLAVRALGKGGDWERATGLLEDMKKAGVSPDDRTFNAAIEVCLYANSGGETDGIFAGFVFAQQASMRRSQAVGG